MTGWAQKFGIHVGAGVIDGDFSGNVAIVLFNFGDREFKIKRGARIAQLICEQIMQPIIVEVVQMEKTLRGINGFGSSGI